MPSLSNSTGVYSDKLYLTIDESVVDLSSTVLSKADKANTCTIDLTNTLLDIQVDDT